jgi:hypothetical protein
MEQPAHVSPRSSVRSHHRDLPRLATNPGWSNPTSSIPGGKAGGTPDSEMGLASPTIATVRQYYLDIGLDMDLQFVSLLRQSPQDIPRRHSEFSPALLTSQMRAFTVSSPTSPSPSVGIAAACHPIVPEFRERPSYGSSLSELARLSSVVSKKGSLQRDRLAQTIGKIPTEYTHFRLREWGPVYLGNVATADVFVRAMHLQKSHRGLSLDSGRSSEKLQNRISPTGFSSKEITVRARVHPKAKERKPFLIQRRFDIQAMQANSLGTNTNDSTIGNKQEQRVTSTDKSSGACAHIRTARSKSISSVGTSDKLEEQEPRRNSSTNFPQISAVRQIMPIR